jgi:hypothetical protein
LTNLSAGKVPALWHGLPGAQSKEEKVSDDPQLSTSLRSPKWLHNRVRYAQREAWKEWKLVSKNLTGCTQNSTGIHGDPACAALSGAHGESPV